MHLRFAVLSSLDMGLTTLRVLMKANPSTNSPICGDFDVSDLLHFFGSLKDNELQQSKIVSNFFNSCAVPIASPGRACRQTYVFIAAF